MAPWEAALGASIPAGTARADLPPGSSSGRRLRLREYGLPNPRARLVISTPRSGSSCRRRSRPPNGSCSRGWPPSRGSTRAAIRPGTSDNAGCAAACIDWRHARPHAAHPRHRLADPARACAHHAAGVRRPEAPRAQHRPVGADTRGDRAHARGREDRRTGARGGREGGGARRHHRRGGPGGARVPRRQRRLPVHTGLQGLPEVVLHEPQRGDLPRHPGLHGHPGRRHRQHRRHRLHRRRARRHERHVPRRRRSARKTGCSSSAPARPPPGRSRRCVLAGSSTSSAG